MIYFLINNSRQLDDAYSHLPGFAGRTCNLIVIAHTLCSSNYSGFKQVLSFNKFSFRNYINSWLTALKIREAVRSKILPNSDDVLFLYTEHEPFNQIIANYFKKSGAKVYLIEDGGFATYIPFYVRNSEPLGLKIRLKEFILNCIPGLRHLSIFMINGILFPRMPDSIFDGVCLYHQVKISRSIRIILIKHPEVKLIRPVNKSVIFLNQPMYDAYQTQESYIKCLNNLLANLVDIFDVVYFKFHPRDNIFYKNLIYKEVIKKFDAIKIVDDELNIEKSVYKLAPMFAASYHSAALLSLEYAGVKPLYLYNLVNDLRNQPISKIMTELLSSMGQPPPDHWSDVSSKLLLNNYLEKPIAPRINLNDLVILNEV